MNGYRKESQNFVNLVSLNSLSSSNPIENNANNDLRIVQSSFHPIIVDGKFFDYLPEKSKTNSYRIVRKMQIMLQSLYVTMFLQDNKNNKYIFTIFFL